MKTILSILVFGFFYSFTSIGAVYYLNSSPGPFPFDPYMGAVPISTLNASNEIYLVEDRAEDHAALLEIQAAYQNLSLDSSQIVANENNPTPLYDDNGLYVKSLTLSNSTLKFDVRNLTASDDFLITRKKALDDNFTNYWVPEWIFTAPSANVGLSIPFPIDSDDGFYLLVNYSRYQGPNLTITSPADNSTNSGTIQVNCSLTDIFQPLAAELYVDGALFQKTYSGPINFTVDTRKIPNGPHIFTVVVSSLIPYSDTAFETSSSTYLGNVVSENGFAAVNMPTAFTASLGAIPYQFQTTAPAICHLVITDTNGLPIRTLLVTNDTAGTFELDWDLTKDDNSPVDVPGSYIVSATAFPKPNGQIVPLVFPPSIVTPLTVHNGLHAGYTATFRAALKSSGDEDWQESLADYISGAIYNACIVHPSDFDGFGRTMNPDARPKIFSSDDDLPNFFTITTNINRYTGHIIWVGHASPSSFGAGISGDTVITNIIGEHDIRNAYGNGYNPVTGVYWFGVGGKRGRIRYAEIDGCSSASSAGDMCVAFGTPKNFNGNPNLEKSAYCGWRDLIYLQGGWPFYNTAESRHVQMLQTYWSGFGIDTPTIGVASLEAFYDAGDDAYISKFAIQGSSGLRWQN